MKFSTAVATLLPLLASVVSAYPPTDKFVEIIADEAGNCALHFHNWGSNVRPCNVITEPIGVLDQATSKCKAFDGSAQSPPVLSCHDTANTLIYSGQYYGGIYAVGTSSGFATRFPLGTKLGCRTYLLPYESDEQPGGEWVQNGCDIDPQLIMPYTQWYNRH